MRVAKIKESKYLRGCYTYDYLKDDGYDCFFRLDNKYVAIKSEGKNIREIVVVDTKKTPMDKVAMSIAMGRKPSMTQETTRTIRVDAIPEERRNNHTYFVYDVLNIW